MTQLEGRKNGSGLWAIDFFFPMLNKSRAIVSHCSYAEKQLKKYEEVVLDGKIFWKDTFTLMIVTQYFCLFVSENGDKVCLVADNLEKCMPETALKYSLFAD